MECRLQDQNVLVELEVVHYASRNKSKQDWENRLKKQVEYTSWRNELVASRLSNLPPPTFMSLEDSIGLAALPPETRREKKCVLTLPVSQQIKAHRRAVLFLGFQITWARRSSWWLKSVWLEFAITCHSKPLDTEFLEGTLRLWFPNRIYWYFWPQDCHNLESNPHGTGQCKPPFNQGGSKQRPVKVSQSSKLRLILYHSYSLPSHLTSASVSQKRKGSNST